MNKTMNNQQETLKAYIAGIMDGEGTFCISHHTYKKKWFVRKTIQVANTSPLIIQFVIDFLKKNNLRFYLRTELKSKTGKLVSYKLRIDRLKDAIIFIDLISGYLTEKKKFAYLVKEFCEYRLSVDNQKRDDNGKFIGFINFERTIGEKDIDFFKRYRALRDSSETTRRKPHNFEVKI